jgi:pimeloyl-ACP methyl ester carboxylesterase
MKVILLFLAGFVLLAFVLWVTGPRARITLPPDSVPEITHARLAAILESEKTIPELKTGVEKEVIWAHPDRRRTEWSLVYLHGFSSSRREISPVMETVATRLGANLFFTRFRGHGTVSGEDMGQVGLLDWLEDAREARAIGHLTGEKVMIAGTSHGGLLAAWVAMLDGPEPVAGLALVSPNFEPCDKRTRWLTLPWANP